MRRSSQYNKITAVISQVSLVHNNCFRNKGESFLVIKTGGIVQCLSVAVIQSCKEAGELHDGLSFGQWSLVLKWFTSEYRSYLRWLPNICSVSSFKEETRMSPFLPRKGSMHFSLGLILWTIVHNSGVVWQLCNWFTVQPHFGSAFSPQQPMLFGIAASMRTCKDAAEFPSSCR